MVLEATFRERLRAQQLANDRLAGATRMVLQTVLTRIGLQSSRNRENMTRNTQIVRFISVQGELTRGLIRLIKLGNVAYQ